MTKNVSFELAKLLKEKGFDKRTPTVWLFSLGKTHLRELHLSIELNDAEYNAPTVAEVVIWLYEKHEIWIEVRKYIKNGLKCFNPYIDNKPVKEEFFNDYDSPTEAYEAAIKYVLDNSI